MRRAQELSDINDPHRKEEEGKRQYRNRKRMLDRVKENEGKVSQEAFKVLTDGVESGVLDKLQSEMDGKSEEKKEGQQDLLDPYKQFRPQPDCKQKAPKSKMKPDNRMNVRKEVSTVMATRTRIAETLPDFRVGQHVVHPNFGTRAKVLEVDRDTLHIQDMDDDGNLLQSFRVVPREAFEAWAKK